MHMHCLTKPGAMEHCDRAIIRPFLGECQQSQCCLWALEPTGRSLAIWRHCHGHGNRPDCCVVMLQMMSRGQQVYSEVDGMTAMLGYQTANAGCCKVQMAC